MSATENNPLRMSEDQRAGRSKSGAAVFFWVIAIVGAACGFLQLFFTMMTATGAPQQVAGGALACALAVMPYVITRAVDELTR